MVKHVQGGYTNYGFPIGILMLETTFPRIVGDIGNAASFKFPVKYKVVSGASPGRVVKEADPALLQPFIEGARQLEAEGVKAITTSCGFLAMFQKQMAEVVNIPLFSSSLIQLPLVYSLIGCRGKVGIITASASSLNEKHFEGVGIENIPKAIIGMDDTEEFSAVFLEGKQVLDVEKVEQEMVLKARKLVKENSEIRAIVFECTNMPPYREAVKKATGLPVFDILTLLNYVFEGIK